MNAKELQFENEARQRLLKGASLIHRAVATTLGPLGNNVVIDRPYGVPAVVHDGVYVAQQVSSPDRFENMGIELMKRAAQETNAAAGDGTTTSIILAYAILKAGHKQVVAGSNAMLLRKGILAATDTISEQLVKLAQPVKTEQEKLHIATISAQDEAIGKSIVKALDLVGANGVVTVEKGSGEDLSIEYKDGLQFNKGILARDFITNPETLEGSIVNPQIVVADFDVTDYNDVFEMLEKITQHNNDKNIVIIAKSFSRQVLVGLSKNKQEDGLNILPIEAPGIGAAAEDYLDDIAVAVNAKVLKQSAGKRLREIVPTDLGSAEEVLSGVEQTLIVGGQPKEFDLKKRVKYLEDQLKRTDLKPYDLERNRERLAKLTGGIAIISVGGNEADIEERTERVIDSLAATRAAIQEGIVPGGETVLLTAREVLKDLKLEGDAKVGVDIVYQAVEAPFKKLIENAGANPEELIAKVIGSGMGIDLTTLELTDLVMRGVVDPVKVTRHALKNAATVATTILSAGATIGLIPDEKPARTTA